MKKNPFLTFIFACVPGAGQMYYGYMQRGLSLITLFFVCVAAGMLVSPLVLACAIVWMYSFFDTYDLIRYIVAGEPKEDKLLILGDFDELRQLIPQHNKLLGWTLIGFGAWTLYDHIVQPFIVDVLQAIGISDAWYYLNRIPTLVVGILLVMGGLWLLGLHPKAAVKAEEPLPDYPHLVTNLPDFDVQDAEALAALRQELDAGVPAAPDLPEMPDDTLPQGENAENETRKDAE